MENLEPMTAVAFLKEAMQVQNKRGETYDSEGGERSMAKVVTVFNTYYGTEMTESQGWHFMEILKDVRQLQKNKYHKDSALDKVSYAALHAESLAKEDG